MPLRKFLGELCVDNAPTAAEGRVLVVTEQDLHGAPWYQAVIGPTSICHNYHIATVTRWRRYKDSRPGVIQPIIANGAILEETIIMSETDSPASEAAPESPGNGKIRRLAARLEPFDTYWQAPEDVEAGFDVICIALMPDISTTVADYIEEVVTKMGTVVVVGAG